MLLHFGPHELDPERYELRSDGEKVDVEPRVLEVLAHLAANPGRVVSREELVEEVWEGKYVSDAAVTKAVGEARRALGDKRIGSVDSGERLIQRLGDRRILLVLDNFEHLMPAAPLLARLPRSCPETTLLVTSRFVLRL